MAKTENSLTAATIVQQLDKEYWSWDDEELKTLGDIGSMLGVIRDRLEKGKCEIAELYGILHDKDTRVVWDDVLMKYIVEFKPPHVHILVKFKKGATLAKLALFLGVAVQYIEKPQKGRYSYDNMLAYLIHIKYEDKHQYDASDVVTNCGKAYQEVFNERRVDWLKGRASMTVKKANIDIDYLVEKILSGEVTKSQVLLTDELFNIYKHNKRRCSEAFETYGERRVERAIQAMKDGEYKISVLFVTGETESGKTYFANKLANDLVEKSKALGESWRVHQTAASNPVDDYNGEEILIMDDVRGSTMNASDWLKLLDPTNLSPNSARFHNVTVACRCIIITSSVELLEFFVYCKQIQNGTEGIDQFLRRLMACVTVYRVPKSMERIVSIGHKIETEKSNKRVRGTELSVSYDFPKVEPFNALKPDDAIEYLSEYIIANNRLLDDKNRIQNIESDIANSQKIASIEGEIAVQPDYIVDEKVEQIPLEFFSETGVKFDPNQFIFEQKTDEKIDMLHEPHGYDSD